MGTALQQARFKYNEIEELRYAALMRQRIDMSRVNLDVLMPWISEKISNVYNIKDFVYEELKKEQHVCPKIFQLKLLKFLNVYKVQQLTTDLWEILFVSQESGIGMPPSLLRQLKEEEEEKQRKRNDSCKCKHCSCFRCSKRDDGVVDDKNLNQLSSQEKRDTSCIKNMRKSRSRSVERPGTSSTSKYALRRSDNTSNESPLCAWCGQTSCYRQSSAASNRSRSPRRRSATREDDEKREYRRKKQTAKVVEKPKQYDVKHTTTIGSQTSVKGSKTSSQKEVTTTPLSSLAKKGSSVPKSQNKKTKSNTESSKAVNGGKVVPEVAVVNCTQSATNNKKKRKKSKKSSSKRN